MFSARALNVTEPAFWGGMAVFTFLAVWHQDTRKKKEKKLAQMIEDTSFFPFANISRVQWTKLPLTALVGASVATAAFVYERTYFQ
jgi:uncharacterized membrane protein